MPETAMTTAKPQRIPNAQRSEATKAVLAEATISAIATHGYLGASTTRIAEIAGLTRGAQKHHFRTKADLVTHAMTELQQHLLDDALGTIESASQLDVDAALQLLWSSLTADLYIAAVELRMAARIDADLRERLIPTEREIGRKIRELLIRALDDGTRSVETVAEVGELAIMVLRDMAMQRMLIVDETREKRQLAALSRAVHVLLEAGKDDA